jgi:hypothetical protein
MLEWSALILLVPLILVPLVLLFGFAGCHLLFKIDPVEETLPETTFQTVLDGETDQRNRTIVQRLEPASLSRSGSRVTITIQRPAAGMLRLMNLFISRASNITDPSRDPYDSADDQTPVLSAELLLAADPNSPTVELPEIDYTFDHTQPLLIAFDIGVEGDLASTAAAVPAFQATAYIGPPPPLPQQPVHEASFSDPDADRQSGYTDRPRIVLIQRIAVR